MLSVLAPIRPIGMNDEMASDWAAVIIADSSHLSDVEFAAGCDRAKRECEDHRQVRKAILKGDPELTAWRKRMDAYAKPFLSNHSPAEPARLSDDSETHRLISQAARSLKGNGRA